MAHTSTESGNLFGQVRNAEAPPPPYGKQNKRTEADGFGFGQINQELAVAVLCMLLNSHYGRTVLLCNGMTFADQSKARSVSVFIVKLNQLISSSIESNRVWVFGELFKFPNQL